MRVFFAGMYFDDFFAQINERKVYRRIPRAQNSENTCVKVIFPFAIVFLCVLTFRSTSKNNDISKSIWRYYTSEDGDFRLKMKVELCKSLKFSNRSSVCIVAKTLTFRSASVDNKSSRRANPAAAAGLVEG